MRRSIAPAVLILALTLAGCSAPADAAPEPVPTVTVTATPEAAPVAPRNEEDYLSALRLMDPQMADLDRAKLIDVGDQVCERAAVGMSAAGIVEWLEDAGMPSDSARAIAAAAAIHLC